MYAILATGLLLIVGTAIAPALLRIAKALEDRNAFEVERQADRETSNVEQWVDEQSERLRSSRPSR